MDVDDETLAHLDSIASIVAGLLEMDREANRIGEPPNDDRKALLVLGEAYMFLYNKLLDDMIFEKED